VIGCALQVLFALEPETGSSFVIEKGGVIGREAERQHDTPLSTEVIAFCEDIFSRGGAILTGPGGGRFVYDMRKQFDLFCKCSPIKVADELLAATRFQPEHVRDVDILVVRENASGVYQGTWTQGHCSQNGRWAEHTFSYRESEVRRIIDVAACIAGQRRGEVAMVYKESGVPTVSALWRDCMADVAARTGVRHSVLDIDHAAYRLIQHPQEFDVLVAPNLIGDLLSDLAGVLVGSRGLTFSGNFNANGAAVYQTNHGSAYDLVGTDRANPVGQIFSLAMMLRESFGLAEEAVLIETAVAQVWREGWRTADLLEKNCRLCGTRQFTDLVAAEVARSRFVPR
jgi:3-isopropylmalate dehydrogenase